MSGCYGDVTQFANDGCTWLLQELNRLEEEADQRPKKWEQHWHKLMYPSTKRGVSYKVFSCFIPVVTNPPVSFYVMYHLPQSALTLHYDEELKRETSVLEPFSLLALWLIIYFRVSLSHQGSTQFLSKLNPLLNDTGWFVHFQM